jgi:ABC-type polysaccharide/polyol phosphate export permease
LLSPFVHVMQFFRSAWFEVYQSQEIDYLYVAIWLGVSSVLAVYYCGRIARHVEAS